MHPGLGSYDPGEFYDELFVSPGTPRPGARLVVERIASLKAGELARRQKAAEARLMSMGITFMVYGEDQRTERILPFDLIPRVVEAADWDRIERGLRQRVYALNEFIHDIYHDQKIIRDGIVPEELVRSGRCYRPECAALNPPRGIWCHVTGIDLVRDQDGTFYVLEDNMRVPSGISYVLENRQVLKRTFPNVFAASHVRPVEDYPNRLLEALEFLTPGTLEDSTVVVLTPGPSNSAYFEHSFLARQMGVDLVEGNDLVVSDGFVYMRTTQGFKRVEVIYRRIDDDFLDPTVFRSDSLLGIPGIMDVYRKGRVAVANAVGTGIADDKVIYALVPQIIKYYLGESAILPNVPTFIAWDAKQRQHILENLDKLVVKAANESGGYGMLIGSQASAKEREEFANLIRAQPRNYMAQPIISLSRVPTLVENGIEGRHVDLRPYVLYGKEIYVLPGGLTRVALRKGSLVVNSSQGGGGKDTWVLEWEASDAHPQ